MAKSTKVVKPIVEVTEVPAKSPAELKTMSTEERKEYMTARRAYRLHQISKGEVIAGRKPVPEDESRNDAFKRLAKHRVTRILEQLKLLGNLSNRSQYDFSDKDVSKIFDAIADAAITCQRKFQDKSKAKPTFDLD